VTADDIDAAGDEASGHTGGQPKAGEVPPDRVANDIDAAGTPVLVDHRDVGQRRVPADAVEEHAEPHSRLPADLEVAADRVVLDRPRNGAASSGQLDVPPDRDSVQQNAIRVGGLDVPLDRDVGVLA